MAIIAIAVFPSSTFAFVPLICDLCTVGVIAGLAVSRYFGIDDTVTGVWIGACLVALIAMTVAFLERKNIRYPLRNTSIALMYIGFMYASFWYMGVIGMYGNTLFGIKSIFADKIVVSSIVGGLVLSASSLGYQAMKRRNNGHAYFPFQKVVMPIVFLILTSVVFYFVTHK